MATKQTSTITSKLALQAKRSPVDIALTAKQAAIFKNLDEYDLDVYQPVHMGKGTLVGYQYNPDAAEAKIIIHEPNRTRSLPAVQAHDVKMLIPSPSGDRFIIMSDNGGDEVTAIPGGHAVEVELADLRTHVVITGTTGRTGGFLDPARFQDLPELHAVDYVSDDDTVVALLGKALVLLKRDAKSGRFGEVSRTKLRASCIDLATAGTIVAVNGSKKLAIYRVVADRFVELGAVDKPSIYGTLFSHPRDARREIWLRENALEPHKGHLLANLDTLPTETTQASPPAKQRPAKPAAKKPTPKSAKIRR